MAYANRDEGLVYYAKYRAENRERIRENSRRYAEKPEIKARDKDSRLRRRYGISAVECDELLACQGNKCKLCGEPFDVNAKALSARAPVVDHNHRTGAVRALLHHACNVRLASVEDLDFALMALTYLRNVGV